MVEEEIKSEELLDIKLVYGYNKKQRLYRKEFFRMLATLDYLDQNRLDDLTEEDSLIPLPPQRSHTKMISIPEALLEGLLSVPPNQEPVARPQRKVCHRLRKLVRTLNGRERKAIRFLYFKGLSRPEVQEIMGLHGYQLDEALDSAFAKLREGLRPLLAS
jgi:DNA-directed RNA polymerase specialized sigma24 family protein